MLKYNFYRTGILIRFDFGISLVGTYYISTENLNCTCCCEIRDSHGELTYLLTELSPSRGAANCAATQELPRMLLNPKVQYRVHKSSALVSILSHINSIHSIPSYLSKIHRLRRPSGLFPSGFPTNILYAFLFSHIRVTCPAHLILLDLHILSMLICYRN
jgi:hypothetical protein